MSVSGTRQSVMLARTQVALTLAEKVLSPPKQEVKVLDVAEVRPPLFSC